MEGFKEYLSEDTAIVEAVSQDEKDYATIKNTNGVEDKMMHTKRTQDIYLKYKGKEVASKHNMLNARSGKVTSTSYNINQDFLKAVKGGNNAIKKWYLGKNENTDFREYMSETSKYQDKELSKKMRKQYKEQGLKDTDVDKIIKGIKKLGNTSELEATAEALIYSKDGGIKHMEKVVKSNDPKKVGSYSEEQVQRMKDILEKITGKKLSENIVEYTDFKLYMNEGADTLETLKSAVSGAKSFMDVGKELKKSKIKYDFSTSPMAIYMVKSGSDKFAIVNKRYADKPDVVIGDIAIGKL